MKTCCCRYPSARRRARHPSPSCSTSASPWCGRAACRRPPCAGCRRARRSRSARRPRWRGRARSRNSTCRKPGSRPRPRRRAACRRSGPTPAPHPDRRTRRGRHSAPDRRRPSNNPSPARRTRRCWRRPWRFPRSPARSRRARVPCRRKIAASACGTAGPRAARPAPPARSPGRLRFRRRALRSAGQAAALAR